MDEILSIYNNLLFEALKEKVKGYVKVKNNSQTNSIYIAIDDGNLIYECGVFDLDSKALNGTFNLEQEVNRIIKGYTKYILSHYLN